MAEALVSAAAAVAVGIISFIGVIISNRKSSRDTLQQLDKVQAVTQVQLDELTREVRMHNDFALRIPLIEQNISAIEATINYSKIQDVPLLKEQLRVVNHRISDLEHINNMGHQIIN